MTKMLGLVFVLCAVLFSMFGCSSSNATASADKLSAASSQPSNSATSGNLVAASSGQSTQTAGVIKDIKIEAFNWGFNQENIVIKKGDHVRLHITSTSGTHGVMIPQLGLSTGRVSPGQEEVLDFVATEAGSFDYFCNVPCGEGHRSMKGKLVVQ